LNNSLIDATCLRSCQVNEDLSQDGDEDRIFEKVSKVVTNRTLGKPPLVFLLHTSKEAVTRDAARSLVNQVPLSTSKTTDKVSRTRERVSSDVTNRNGPRSWAIRATKGESAESSPPSQKLVGVMNKNNGARSGHPHLFIAFTAETFTGIVVPSDSRACKAASM